MNNIVWLASYPKSGNTWVRTFLTYLQAGDKVKVDVINNLVAPIFSSRSWTDDYLMLESSELSPEETEKLQGKAITEMCKTLSVVPFFMKAHDAYVLTTAGCPIYPAEASRGAVYIVRNPLDVATSFAIHQGISIDDMIEKMADETSCLLGNERQMKSQLRQRLLSWSGHVNSWLQQQDIPVLLVRYEDMKTDPFHNFRKIAEFSGLNVTDAELGEAIDKSSFEKLKEQEKQFGFREKRHGHESFFREGRAGSWRENLTTEQAQRIISTHKDMMLQLGYLDAAGNPV